MNICPKNNLFDSFKSYSFAQKLMVCCLFLMGLSFNLTAQKSIEVTHSSIRQYEGEHALEVKLKIPMRLLNNAWNRPNDSLLWIEHTYADSLLETAIDQHYQFYVNDAKNLLFLNAWEVNYEVLWCMLSLPDVHDLKSLTLINTLLNNEYPEIEHFVDLVIPHKSTDTEVLNINKKQHTWDIQQLKAR